MLTDIYSNDNGSTFGNKDYNINIFICLINIW